MKSVLISIQPKWVEKIAIGEKTIEVRKTRPKLDTPFKCYIYCTKHKERLIEVVHKGDDMGYCVYNEDTPMFIKTFADMALLGTNMVGKVIGEFVCDRIDDLRYVPTKYYLQPAGTWEEMICNNSCLSVDEIKEYAKGKAIYAWHISDLKIYDKPKELNEFKRECPIKNQINGDCHFCKYANYTQYGNRPKCNAYLEKPPQSWYYIED